VSHNASVKLLAIGSGDHSAVQGNVYGEFEHKGVAVAQPLVLSGSSYGYLLSWYGRGFKAAVQVLGVLSAN
jgi:hypothetical protein